MSRLSDDDRHLFNEGRHTRLYHALGAHVDEQDGRPGVNFAVWAPDASGVSVFGQFNEWGKGDHQLWPVGSTGIWEGFVEGVGHGDAYKYEVVPRAGGPAKDKADPFATYAETPPSTASRVWALDYDWADDDWMETRGGRSAHDAPVAIYELHVGSWRRGDDGWPLTYRQLAEVLPDYLVELGFTHVELMPVMEHPYLPSWGYQTTGYFAPTSRFGTPQDLMALIDALHQARIGVILDWVPSHFPMDDHGLARFDGTALYEHADPRQGFHPDWQSAIFNYGRAEVRSFLLSSAMFWLDRYHVDGIRVDAVASMLYLDYSRDEGEWIPNVLGGNENLEAVSFLQELNSALYGAYPGIQTYAEESTAWPGVTRPVDAGGLGFGYKWDMGWMHDTLRYLSREPVHRKHHHNELTFRSLYSGNENFTLALSHDEVVHGKGSLLNKMPGDEWQRFANLRLLLTYQYTAQGKKLLFMGGEFGQWSEWDHDSSLDWHLLDHGPHQGIYDLTAELGRLHLETPALHRGDHHPDGFRWVDADNADESIYAYARFDPETGDSAVVVLNFTPVVRPGYQVRTPVDGRWTEVLNSDDERFGGSGVANQAPLDAITEPDGSGLVTITVPPLAGLILLPGS